MAYEKKNIIIGGVAGVLMAALIISGLLWAGVVPSLPTEEKGFLVIKVKDDPVALQELWLQIDAVRVHRKGYGNETWTNITLIGRESYQLETTLKYDFM